jgi:hypothetical protein
VALSQCCTEISQSGQDPTECNGIVRNLDEDQCSTQLATYQLLGQCT